MAGQRFEERWGNFRDLVEQMFLDPDGSGLSDVLWYPATDAYETPEAFVVRMDLSGVQRDDMRIDLKGVLLHVRGVRRELGGQGEKRFHKMEIALGPFARTVRLPDRYAGASASARYRAGILEIILRPRKRAKSLEIEITVVQAPQETE